MKWKEIPNTDGLYLVSDTGKVFSVRTNKILKTGFRDGYEHIELNINGKAKKHYIHRLVAEAFIPNPNDYPVINHKDENPANNCADNLEWCTQKYNVNYGNCIEKRKQNRKPKNTEDYVNSVKVYQFDLDGNFIAEYGSGNEAGRATGLRGSSITRAAKGDRRQYAGYYWSTEKEFSFQREIKSILRKGALLKCDESGNVVKRYETPQELKADGYNQIQVNRVCRGERKTYKGYTWKHEGE